MQPRCSSRRSGRSTTRRSPRADALTSWRSPFVSVRATSDLYYDSVSKVQLATWTRGRIALAIAAGALSVWVFLAILQQREGMKAFAVGGGVALFVAALVAVTLRLREDGLRIGAAGLVGRLVADQIREGERKGQHSIRINDQWRICFRWREEGVHDVEIVDYH